MITCTVAGNLGKEAETKQLGGGVVTKFTIASSSKVKGEDKVVWLDCDYWGKPGESVAPYLKKGTPVCVSGSLSTREHDGKTYLSIRVDNLKLMGGGKSEGGSSQRSAPKQSSKPSGGGGFSDSEYTSGADEDLPF